MALLATHHFRQGNEGPKLVALGAVHGNETCGTRAILRTLDELAAGSLRLTQGSLTLVPVTNQKAYEQKTRHGDRNLNRNLRPTARPQDNEDHIANELCPILAAHDVLLDLHSFHSPGSPFVMLGPENNDGPLQPFARAAEESAFALTLGVERALDGWLETYASGATRRGGDFSYGVGTTEYMRQVGGYAVTLECGQHADPEAPEVGYRAIMNALAHLRMIDRPAPKAGVMDRLRLCEVFDREHAGDVFIRSWKSFDPVRGGEVIARRSSGMEVTAPDDGFIVFPNEKSEPGTEWFYFAQRRRWIASD